MFSWHSSGLFLARALLCENECHWKGARAQGVARGVLYCPQFARELEQEYSGLHVSSRRSECTCFGCCTRSTTLWLHVSSRSTAPRLPCNCTRNRARERRGARKGARAQEVARGERARERERASVTEYFSVMTSLSQIQIVFLAQFLARLIVSQYHQKVTAFFGVGGCT